MPTVLPGTDLAKLLPAGATVPALTLSISAITPVYLGGAQQQLSEQGGSVRGNLRWWLRALLGGATPPGAPQMSAADLGQAESRVLGSTVWNAGLRVCLEKGAIVHPPGNFDPQHYLYVGWAMEDRTPWSSGQSFAVTISGAPNLEHIPEGLALAAAAWCWVNLGALGARGRRGFGALHLDAVSGPLAEAFARACDAQAETDAVWRPPDSAVADDWDRFLRRGLDGAVRAAAGLVGQTLSTPPTLRPPGAAAALPNPMPLPLPEWASFAPGHWRALVLDCGAPVTDQPAWANALIALSRRLHAFRLPDPYHSDPNKAVPVHIHSTDAAEVIRAAQGGNKIDLNNDEFGLPWPWQIGQQRAGVAPQGVGRRASPVIARPVYLVADRGATGVLFLAFRSRFLPGATPTKLRGRLLGNETGPDGEPVLDHHGKPIPRVRTVAPVPAHLPQTVAFMEWLTTLGDPALADLPV